MEKNKLPFEVMNINSKSKTIAISFLATYLILRLALEPFFWKNISIYYSYLFEIFFSFIAFIFYHRNLQFFKKISHKEILLSIFSLLSGFLVFKVAIWSKITVPINFSSYETLLLLLVVAPFLEEMIFRMALWESLRSLFHTRWSIIFVSALLFSLGHLNSLWFLPETFHSFILYQTFYVFILGLFLGQIKWSFQSLASPILIHFSFNLGFFFASLESF